MVTLYLVKNELPKMTARKKSKKGCQECSGEGYFECHGRTDLDCKSDETDVSHFHLCYCDQKETKATRRPPAKKA